MTKKAEISGKEKDDIQTLMKFVGIYCRENHNGGRLPFSFKLIDRQELTKGEVSLCPDCHRLLTYGLTMRMKCPHDPKPMCKRCETQCYRGEYKAKIREVMKFSGMYLVKQGRLDLLYHYFIRLRRRPRLRAETPGHFGVQARPMAVDECEEDNPPKPCA